MPLAWNSNAETSCAHVVFTLIIHASHVNAGAVLIMRVLKKNVVNDEIRNEDSNLVKKGTTPLLYWGWGV